MSALTVLVDDDALVRLTWKTAASRGGHEFRSFESPETFFADSTIPTDAILYIDWQLTKDGTAESFLNELKGKGFADISIATGQDAKDLPKLEFVREITGKNPPWK